MQAGILGIMVIISGASSAIFMGGYLDRSKKYVFSLRVICIMTSVVFLIFIFAIRINFWLCFVLSIFVGMFMIPIIPTSYSLSVELTHPANPALVNGMMTSLGYVNATIMTLGGSWIANKSPTAMLCIFLGEAILAGVLSMCVKEDLRRAAGVALGESRAEGEAYLD